MCLNAVNDRHEAWSIKRMILGEWLSFLRRVFNFLVRKILQIHPRLCINRYRAKVDNMAGSYQC